MALASGSYKKFILTYFQDDCRSFFTVMHHSAISTSKLIKFQLKWMFHVHLFYRLVILYCGVIMSSDNTFLTSRHFLYVVTGECNISEQPAEKRHTQPSSQLSGHCVLSKMVRGGQTYLSKDDFCSSFFIQWLTKCFLTSTDSSVLTQSCNIMNGIQALNSKSDAFLKEKVFFFGCGRMYS